MTRYLAILLTGLVFTGLALAGCDMPYDPDGTLDRVRGGTIQVGALDGNHAALDADRAIVARLARALDAEVAIQQGEAHSLVRRLAEGHIDLLIGGIPEDTPFAAEIGMSRAAGTLFEPAGKRRVLAVRKGENGFLIAVNRAIAANGEGPAP